jgi:hypothetical protein
MRESFYLVEMTDTFGGEANYSWCHRLNVRAISIRGAVRKARKYWGESGRIRKIYDCGDSARYDVTGACVCIFVHFEIDPDRINIQTI